MEERHYLLTLLTILFTLITSAISDCIDIEQCPAAMKYIEDLQNNEIHNSSIQVLRAAYCGSTKKSKKVSCEKVPSCYEPSDKNFCIKAIDCCVALRITSMNVSQNEDVKRRLKQFRCSSKNQIKVKCGALVEVEEILLKNLLKSKVEDTCITPSGSKGRCIHWKSCPTFRGKATSSNFVDYLRRSVCDKKNQRVCCGFGENVDDVCGLDNSATDKIAGGTATTKNEFPWVVILKYSSPETVCGGTLINSQFVLTAAHCIRSDLTKIRIGGNFHGKQNNNLRFDIAAIRKHPNYKRRPLNFDIALLKIQKVTYQDNIKWICLPPASNRLPTEFVIVGNGKTQEGHLSKRQLKATVPFVENSQCWVLYRNLLNGKGDSIICAGGVEGVDTCAGDSGGPLMSKVNTSVWHLYGIVSGGVGDCAVGIPGFYTRVDKFLNWINLNMKDMLI